jgi:hypothetical protein
MNTDTGPLHDHDGRRISRVIDMKLPLAWLLGAAFSFALLIGGMYFQLGQLSKDVTELKSTVTAGNSQQSEVHGELAILKYRMDMFEKGGAGHEAR